MGDEARAMAGKVRVPVYLNRTRRHVVFTVALPCDAQVDPRAAAQRGIALVCSALI